MKNNICYLEKSMYFIGKCSTRGTNNSKHWPLTALQEAFGWSLEKEPELENSGQHPDFSLLKILP